MPVCHAIQHAHQKGIIHRDLKPGNILIYLEDGKPVPKVIDFGLAKSTIQLLVDDQAPTESGMALGTYLYMPPEQTNTSNLAVDTRADVYSLGAVLYEVLTGTPPFTYQELSSDANRGALEKIREESPPIPSQRLAKLPPDSLSSASAVREMDSKRLVRMVHGDLDWIVMKCLEKPRERRYDTAQMLANDIERFLNDDTVTAGPPSVTYRVAKFYRRNRVGVWAASLVVLSLVGGTVAAVLASINYRQMLAERDRAEQKEQEAKRAEPRMLVKQIEAAAPAQLPSLVGFYRLPQPGFEEVLQAAEAEASNDEIRARYTLMKSVGRTELIEFIRTQPLQSPLRDAAVLILLQKPQSAETVIALLLTEPSGRLNVLAEALRKTDGAMTAVLAHLAKAKTPQAQARLQWTLGELPKPAEETFQQLTAGYESPVAATHAVAEWLMRRWDPDQLQQLALKNRGRDFGGWSINNVGQTLIHFNKPPFDFEMGAKPGESARVADRIRHKRRIDRPFAIGATEVTVRDYLSLVPEHRATLEKNPEYQKSDRQPVTALTWHEAALFCNRLSKLQGIPEDQWFYTIEPQGTKFVVSYDASRLNRIGYRLPTEAEWEFAARGGRDTAYPFGDDPAQLPLFAWGYANSGNRLQPVGRLLPNPYGLFDTLGNAGEWTLTDYIRDYPTTPVPVPDGLVFVGPEAQLMRVVRGGTIFDEPANLRCARRMSMAPSEQTIETGFRVARTLPKTP